MQWIWHNYHDLGEENHLRISLLRKSFFEADAHHELVKDEYDEACLHLTGTSDSNLVAYGRIIPPHTDLGNPFISRTIVVAEHRNKGHGRALIKILVEKSKELFPEKITQVSSLASTKMFYEKNNFVEEKKIIDTSGIEHFIMSINDK